MYSINGLRGFGGRVIGTSLLLALVFFGREGRAENNTDYVFDGTTTNFGASFVLPNTSPGTSNSLQILNGGAVTNDVGSIGAASTDPFNYVLVSGTNSSGDPSIWRNNTEVYIGNFASFSQLIVSNGALVSTPRVFVGRNGASASNTVLVTGAGSLLNIAGGINDLHLGFVGNGANNLFILDGGRVNNGATTISSGISPGNNQILVSGAGSVWSNSGTINLGQNAGGNLLTIANGGRVDAADASVGFAENNQALVTGSNSLWSLTGGLGMGGHNANVTIADGGRIENLEAYIGNGISTSTNVSAVVTGTDSRWILSGDMSVGWSASGTRLVITNGGRIDSNRGFIGRNNPSSNNTVIVTGNNSLWSIAGDLFMSFAGPGSNQLQISDGGRVKNNVGRIGSSTGNNLVTVSGPNSVWSNTGSLHLGENAGGNRLVITNGGRVDAADVNIGGPAATTPDNHLLVTGSNSLLSLSTSGFGIALGGHEARLTVENGGRVINSDAYIGNGLSTATNVVALVTGTGSVWTNASTMNVGWTASRVALVITNGGRVDAGQSFVGRFAGSQSNTLVVTGEGSQWNHRLNLHVGIAGAGAGSGSVLVENGGLIEAGGFLGGSSGSGTISNRGGIYQFISATPTVTPNTAGSIMITNGTISYRGVNGADINNASVAQIVFQGNNTFRLNNSTNTSVASYTFDSVANTGSPSNYCRLALADGGRWQSTTLTIGSGGALIGDGTVASANVTNHGVIAPGFSAGTLTLTSNLVLGATSQLQMEIGGTDPLDYDRIIVAGNLSLTGSLALSVINSFSPTAGDTFTILENTSLNPTIGQFAGLTNNQFIDASQNGIDAYFVIQYDAGIGGNDVVLLATVPEPGVGSLLLLGALGLLRRKRGQK